MATKKKMDYLGIPTLEEFAANKVDLWISTGIDPIDVLIHPAGGIPAGRITVIHGEESAGKSTLLAHIFKSCHDQGIATVLCDAENTFSAEFAGRIGMDPEKVGVLIDKKSKAPIRSIEELDTALQLLIKNFYASQDPDTPLLIGIDSIEALDTASYVKSKKRIVGDRARTWGPFWRSIADLQKLYRHLTVVVLNQVRTNIQTSVFSRGPSEVSPGGRALGFYSSLKLKLQHRRTLTNPKKKYLAYATVIEVKVEKSKVGTPFRKCLIYNRFDKGFDNPKSVIYFLADNGVLKKQAGKSLVYTCEFFKLEDVKIAGKKRTIAKLTLNQARSFLSKYGWKALFEPIKKEWM